MESAVAALLERELARFEREHPRSHELARQADESLLAGVPMPWMVRWAGGFPIERTYTEWVNSRYADRPGNTNFEPAYKRDCQTCHMQQDYGAPGTAQVLYRDGRPIAPLAEQLRQEIQVLLLAGIHIAIEAREVAA